VSGNVERQMKIGVIGSGVMGKQLIKLLAKSHFEVTVLTRNKELALKEFNTYSNAVNVDNLLKLISFTEDVSELSQCRLIFECLPEVKEIKLKYYNEIFKLSESLIASCTSTFTLAELSATLNNPSKLQIAHFSNPMSKLNLVEVVLAKNLTAEEQELFIGILNQLQRKIFYVPDQHGFVLNKLLFPYLKQALNLKMDCELSTTEIDEIMRSGCNFPLGPFATMRLIGVPTVLNVFTSLGIDLDDNQREVLLSLK
jgi:3-hydroxybutyryl-CoA dehydrogenase